MRITTAMAAGMGAGLAYVGVAQADEIFFPYIVRSPTVTSVVSVVNIESTDSAAVHAENLHYTYYYRAGFAANRVSDACQELDFQRTTSPNDIQTFDVGDKIAPDRLGVLFNDPSISNDYLTANLSYSGLVGLAPSGQPDQVQSFLLVDNNAMVGGQYANGRLYGEAWILDFVSGAAWGYRAYNSIVDEALWADGQLAPGEFAGMHTFSNQFETEGEVLNGLVPVNDHPPVHFLPDDEFAVRFFVTPVDASTDLDLNGRLDRSFSGELGNQRQGDLATRISLYVDAPAIGGGVVYDRDENPISGPLQQDVVCVGAVNASGKLLSLGVLNQLKLAGSDGGGWSLFRNSPPSGGNTTAEAVVFRLDFNRSTQRRFANAVWLRNGTDRSSFFESLIPVSTYDVNSPAGVQTWGADGIPSVYRPLP